MPFLGVVGRRAVRFRPAAAQSRVFTGQRQVRLGRSSRRAAPWEAGGAVCSRCVSLRVIEATGLVILHAVERRDGEGRSGQTGRGRGARGRDVVEAESS